MGPPLTHNHIEFFLLHFKVRNVNSAEDRKAIIDIFINVIYLYNDWMSMAFNYRLDGVNKKWSQSRSLTALFESRKGVGCCLSHSNCYRKYIDYVKSLAAALKRCMPQGFYSLREAFVENVIDDLRWKYVLYYIIFNFCKLLTHFFNFFSFFTPKQVSYTLLSLGLLRGETFFPLQ